MLHVYSERQPVRIEYKDGTTKRIAPFFRWRITNRWVELGIPGNNAIGIMYKCKFGNYSRIKKWLIEIGLFTIYVNYGGGE